jgi:hypothetical protein
VARLDAQISQQTSVNADLKTDLERRQAAAAAAQQAVTAPPAPGSSAAGSGTVDLPPIQLGQPGTPAPGTSSSVPAPPGTSGIPPAEVYP